MTSAEKPAQDSNITEVLQSLIVAFVLAMAFRGFVLEGFIIPSGSMAPTLMGQHVRWRSDVTGYEFAFDGKSIVDSITASRGRVDPSLRRPVSDPMLGESVELWAPTMAELSGRVRMGDRVLVMKAMYLLGKWIPAFAPSRWDVVVFKCPTDPVGERQNFIKRLVGLPNESILFADGDLFTGPVDATDARALHVQRKPEYIQRAVWQPVFNSDYVPVSLDRLSPELRGLAASPWVGQDWTVRDGSGPLREYRTDSSGTTTLRWDSNIHRIDDWNAYNKQLLGLGPSIPVSDVRVCAAIDPEQPESFSTTFRLSARGHLFEFIVAPTSINLRIVEAESGSTVASSTHDWTMPAHPWRVEFWHVDQAMKVFIDERLVAELEYDWTAMERLEHALFGPTIEQYRREPESVMPQPPDLSWAFTGSPVTMRSVRVDRDLYYRPAKFSGGRVPADFAPTSNGLGFGIDPMHPGVLGDDHFMMCGDNSPASSDARVWGASHPLTEQFIDTAPFVVHRKLLLGKAWAVYLPSPVPVGESGRTLIPDFGRLRFIR